MEWVKGEVIGRGSFGTVNLATVTQSNSNSYETTSSVVAVVKSSHMSHSTSLLNEKQVLTELGNCDPNIIRCLGDSISHEKGTLFYNVFLEYASKGSLWDHLRNSDDGEFGNVEVRRYTRGILRGLCRLHDSGFVHSDIKLHNILVFDDDEVKIADFGLSRRVGECHSGGQLRGTPLYMSPELIAGAGGGTAADVWAVGCAVVEMLTGKPAWECSPESDVSGLFYRVGVCGECPRIPEGLSDEGRDFLGKCFVKDPNERWTARMLLDHPFVSGCDGVEVLEKRFVSPRCPFEFPDWESVEDSNIVYGSNKSCLINSITRRLESELSCGSRPSWDESDGEWVTIR